MMGYKRDLACDEKPDPSIVTPISVDGRTCFSFPVCRNRAVPFFIGYHLSVISLMDLIPAVILWGSVIVESGCPWHPSTLFATEGDATRKLEWDAFRQTSFRPRHGYGSIHRRHSMWGSWLVVTGRPGVGDKVEKAMKELDIRIPEPLFLTGIRGAFIPVLFFSPPRGRESGASVEALWRWRGFGGGVSGR